jgi:cytochrome b561
MSDEARTEPLSQERRSALGYGRTAMMFHWLIAGLILIDFALALSFSKFNPGDVLYFSFAYRLHMSTGLAVLALSVACVAWRLLHKSPPLPQTMSALTRVLAKTAHVLLYVFIIAIPVTGWAILSVRKSRTALLGQLNLPNIAYLEQMTREQRVRYYEFIFPAHIKWSYIGMSLVGLHILAALYHHFYRHDDVLKRMWPGRRTR